MSRLLAALGVLACALCLTGGAAAANRSHSPRHGHAAAATHAVTGTVTAVGYSSVTVVTNGRRMGVINAMTNAASAITREDYPYVWGGGHAVAGVASAGMAGGPGYNGRRVGFDCSGSVAAVLAAGGLWPAGGGVPSDLGVIDQLLAEHVIAPGPGRTPAEVTLYDHPGVHIFMNIDGRFFGTSDGAGGGSRKGGPGWLDDGAPDAYTRVFRQYHVLPSVLHDSTLYGHSYTLESANSSLLAGVAVGDRVQVRFASGPSGTLSLLSLSWVGAHTVAGQVSAIAAQGFGVLTPGGTTLLLSAPAGLARGLALGDQVSVTYTARGAALTARALTVTAQPTVVQATGAVTALASDGSSLTIAPASGPALTFSTAGQTGLLAGLVAGEQVQVSYIQIGTTLIAQSVDAAPSAPVPGGSTAGRWLGRTR